MRTLRNLLIGLPLVLAVSSCDLFRYDKPITAEKGIETLTATPTHYKYEFDSFGKFDLPNNVSVYRTLVGDLDADGDEDVIIHGSEGFNTNLYFFENKITHK